MASKPMPAGHDADDRDVPTTTNDLSAVRENRDALKDLAESDLPVSWIAEALLDAEADAHGG